MKSCSASLVIREVKLKSYYTTTFGKMNQSIPSLGEDAAPYTTGWSIK